MIQITIRNRRAVFADQFNGEPISRETLVEILEAARWAPTHRRTEPWRFKVIQGEKLEELGAFLAEKYQQTAEKFAEFKHRKFRENPKKAGAILAICMQRDPKESVPEWEEIASVAMAVQNMWLVCTEKKIGAYWSSPELIRYMDEFLPLAPGERCLGFFYMGYYDQPLQEGIRTPIEEKTTWL